MATYNGEKWLTEQTDSILGQIGVDTHLFVSDDLSTDSTWELLRCYKTDQITLLPRSEKFGSSAQNFFRLLRDADFSHYDFVAFSDQDDIWNNDKLLHSVETLTAKSVDAFSSDVTAFWPNGRKAHVRKSHRQKNWDHLFQSAGPGCTYVMRRSPVEEVAEFLRSHRAEMKSIALHDWFLYQFSRNRGWLWWIDPRSTMLYRQHEENEFGVNNGLKAALDRWDKMMKGWYRTQVLMQATLCGAGETWPIRRLQRYSYLDRLVLGFSVLQLRRSLRDCMALALAFLTTAAMCAPGNGIEIERKTKGIRDSGQENEED